MLQGNLAQNSKETWWQENSVFLVTSLLGIPEKANVWKRGLDFEGLRDTECV